MMISSAQTEFAILSSKTTEILRSLSDLEGLRFEAILESEMMDRPGQRWMKKGEVLGITVSINVYGPSSISNDVGKSLSNAGVYLQHPSSLDEHIEYNNPHYFQLPNRHTKWRTNAYSHQEPKASRRPKEVNIAEVFQSIGSGHDLQSINVTAQIKTPLLRLDSF